MNNRVLDFFFSSISSQIKIKVFILILLSIFLLWNSVCWAWADLFWGKAIQYSSVKLFFENNENHATCHCILMFLRWKKIYRLTRLSLSLVNLNRRKTKNHVFYFLLGLFFIFDFENKRHVSTVYCSVFSYFGGDNFCV